MLISKKLSKWILAGAIIAIASFLLVYILFSKFQHPNKINIKNIDAQEQEQLGLAGLPVRLKIPAIEVDAVVEQAGLTPAGAMDTPKGPDDVAWFSLGTRPGENGSAVITGHYGTWKNGNGSVFDNLHKLKKGDNIYIEDEKGETISFVVRESRNYEPDAETSEVFSSDDEMSHLNLITCEGTWDKDLKSYSERLVVFADKE
ncbi:MAG: class F sortase [bacterium]|nr:class F sortase [bacterium]